MGAPVPEMNPELNSVEEATAEAFVSALRTITAPERRKHASVYNYWLSIRRDREFPPIRDLDPLEISDAGPFSILLEMIGGGEDAEVRHLGQAIKGGIQVEKIGEAPDPSLLSCIAKRLPVVAACRDAFAFEDQFETADGKTRCWVTLLPFSATGTWIDYVYGFVSVDPAAEGSDSAPAEELVEVPVAEVEPELVDEAEPVEEIVEPGPVDEVVEAKPVDEFVKLEAVEENSALELSDEYVLPDPVDDTGPEPIEQPSDPVAEFESPEPQEAAEPVADQQAELEPEAPASDDYASAPEPKAGFSKKIFDKLSNVGGFYGNPVEVELDMESVAFETGPVEIGPEQGGVEAEQSEDELAPAAEPIQTNPVNSTSEGPLQSKLEEVRAKADEARQAKLRANASLYEGLSAAYDFALDAEEAPEEYLRLVEAQGLKIQLRAPMKPVVKLAFDGMCDDATIKQLEAILAWAFDEELPRGTLAERIEAEGGLGPILSGQAKAA